MPGAAVSNGSALGDLAQRHDFRANAHDAAQLARQRRSAGAGGDAEQREARADDVEGAVRAEQSGAAGGVADGGPHSVAREQRRGLVEAAELLSRRVVVGRVGAGEMGHQALDADLREVAEARSDRGKLLERDAEAGHSRVDLQMHVDGPLRGADRTRRANAATWPMSWTTGMSPRSRTSSCELP